MPDYAVECEDGRVFQIAAESAEAALADVAQRRNLRPSALKAAPVPRHEREFAMPLFWGALALVAALVAIFVVT